MKKLISKLDRTLKGRALKPSDCVTEQNESLLFIEDVKDFKCVFVNTNEVTEDYLEQKTLKIDNPTQKSICLWAIDGCFVKMGKHLSATYQNPCDCAFGGNSFFCLVEFKLEATSLVPAQVQKNREKAKK